jgi:hypothetical protein
LSARAIEKLELSMHGALVAAGCDENKESLRLGCHEEANGERQVAGCGLQNKRAYALKGVFGK